MMSCEELGPGRRSRLRPWKTCLALGAYGRTCVLVFDDIALRGWLEESPLFTKVGVSAGPTKKSFVCAFEFPAHDIHR